MEDHPLLLLLGTAREEEEHDDTQRPLVHEDCRKLKFKHEPSNLLAHLLASPVVTSLGKPAAVHELAEEDPELS